MQEHPPPFVSFRPIGLVPEYDDAWGESKAAPHASCVALAAAMYPDRVVADDWRQAAEAEARAAAARVLPPVVVVRGAGADVSVVARLKMAAGPRAIDWRVVAEDGRVHGGVLEVAPPRMEPADAPDPDVTRAIRLTLPVCLPEGYHQLHIATRDQQGDTQLVVAPQTCFRPTALADGIRRWGLAVQLYAVRSATNWGIGDFADLQRVIERGAEMGVRLVGVNPLHLLFRHDVTQTSPYSPSSRSFIHPLYLDVAGAVEQLDCVEARRLMAEDAFQQQLVRVREAAEVCHGEIWALKKNVLELLSQHFRREHFRCHSAQARDFEAFVQSRGEVLQRLAVYEALQRDQHDSGAGWGWLDWSAEYQDPTSAAVRRHAAEHPEAIRFSYFLQWLADRQLAAVARRAEELDVWIYRDLALGAHEGGAEAWSNQRLFARDVTVGAPPDDFNLKGQDWGLPPPIPHRMIDSACEGWRRVLRDNMRHAGVLRVDHVMSLMRLFWIPRGMLPVDGAYVCYPLAELMGILALESQRNRCVVVGEDLGTVPAEMREAMARHDIYSYRVFYFQKDETGAYCAPEDYPEQALAVVSTHDLPTLHGFWRGRDIDEREALALFPDEETARSQREQRSQDRRAILRRLGAEGLLPSVSDETAADVPRMTHPLCCAVHRLVARSAAQLMMVQLEDLVGQLDQVNLPGTTHQRPNWCYRLAIDLETLFDCPEIRKILAGIDAERPASGCAPLKGGAVSVPAAPSPTPL